jgi:hypothetical protein
MNGVSSVMTVCGDLQSPPQVIYLNQGVALYETRG